MGTHKGPNHVDEKKSWIILHRSTAVGRTNGNYSKPRRSDRTIHDALQHSDDAMLFLSDLRAIADGDHECYVRGGNEIGRR